MCINFLRCSPPKKTTSWTFCLLFFFPTLSLFLDKVTYVWVFFRLFGYFFSVRVFRSAAICLQVLVGDYLLSVLKHHQCESVKKSAPTAHVSEEKFFFSGQQKASNTRNTEKKKIAKQRATHHHPSEHMFVPFFVSRRRRRCRCSR